MIWPQCVEKAISRTMAASLLSLAPIQVCVMLSCCNGLALILETRSKRPFNCGLFTRIGTIMSFLYLELHAYFPRNERERELEQQFVGTCKRKSV